MGVDGYKLVLQLLHFVFTVVCFCWHLCILVKIKCSQFIYRSGKEWFLNDKHIIDKNMKHLTKLPAHFAVILGTEVPNFQALSKLIFWCLSAGIPNISFYDHQGILISSNHKMYDYLSKWKRENDKIVWNMNTHGTCGSQIIYKNGLKKELSVNFLSPADCKLKISEVCRDMAIGCDLPLEKINIATINEKCSAIISPDPDLAICFGDICCTYGFLPWHIRLTEFIQIQSQQTLTIDEFMRTLFKYSKCEQRFGA